MEEYVNSSKARSGIEPVNINNPSWLASIDKDFQDLVGFGACVAQGVIELSRMFAQTEMTVAKIDAESRVVQSKITSVMPMIHEEVKRLGARIDRVSSLLLDKYTASDLTREQAKEKENLEKMMEQDQHKLDKLLQCAMANIQTS